MKVRTDYITNSSSSSFILAFSDEKDYNKFKEYANWLEYNDFANLIETVRNEYTQDEMRANANEFLRNYYGYKEKKQMMREKFEGIHFENYVDRIKAENEYENSEEFQNKLKEKIEKTEYKEKKERLDQSDIVIETTVWDTNGGLLEWAVRKGFVESEFYEWLLLQHNVG